MSFKSLIFIALGLLLLYLLFTVGAPFLLAAVVAIFIEPLNMLFMKRLRMNRITAGTITSTIFTILLLGLIMIVGFKVFAELLAFFQRVPGYVTNANQYVDDIMNETQAVFQHLPEDTVIQIESWLLGLTDTMTSALVGLSKTVINFISGIPGMFIFFIVFLVAVYMFSYSLPTMKQSVLSLFEEKSRPKVDEVLMNLKKSIFGFLRSQIILSGLTYIISLAGLLILDVKYPLAIALLIVIVDIMPILGTGSVLVPWGTFLLATGDIYTGIGLYILFLVITVFRRIVEPKILGDSVGIGALPALISLYVGFKLVGVIGVFLGPIVVIIYIAARKAGLFQVNFKV